MWYYFSRSGTQLQENKMKKRFLLAALAIIFSAGVCDAKSPFSRIKPEPAKPTIGGDVNKKEHDKLMESFTPLGSLADDSRALYSDQNALIHRVKDIQTFLSVSANALGVLTTVDTDLQKLEVSAKALYGTAEAASAIPQAREKAQKVKTTLGATLKNITAARQRMDAIVAKPEPVRVKMAAAAERARQLELGLTGLNSVVDLIPSATVNIEACLKRLPEDKQACAKGNVEDTAIKVDSAVREYDRVVKVLIYTPDGWLPSMNFFDPFSADMRAIEKLREDIEALYARVEKLSGELAGLNAVLDRNFSFGFPYPNPTWTNPARMSTYDVSIGFRTIIQGANTIQDRIQEVLSSFLWGILKGLGVGGYVNYLIDQANNAVNALMSMVGFDAALDLPDMSPLDAFGDIEVKLMADLDGLKFPAVGADLPGFGFPGVGTGFNFGILSGSFPSACSAAAYNCN